jgi:hypothetical protein
MRCLTTLLILLCTMLTTVAQNYQCVQPGSKQYFTNSTHYLRGIRIDSTKTIGGVQYLYPFKSPRGKYYEEPLQPGGSWLGDVIMIAPDGTHLFINHAKDTVVIKPQAAVNASWVLYDDTTTIRYIATLTQADTMTVLNTLDSIKAITITAFDGSTPLTTDPLHNKRIILSKTHGFVQVTDLYNLPFKNSIWLHDSADYFTAKTGPASLFKLVDFYNPTMNDLYNYNVGDIIQYSTYPEKTAERITTEHMVTQKQAPAVGHTIYTCNTWNQIYSLTQMTVTMTIPKITSIDANTTRLIDETLMPEEWGQKKYILYDTRDTSFCSGGAMYTIGYNNIEADGWVNTFEPPGIYIKYKVNIGLIEDVNATASDWRVTRLKYVNRSGAPCGYKETLGVPNVDKPTLNIYPNPANDVLHVEATVTGTLYLINTFGQIVHTATLDKGTTTILTATLPAGNYVLKLEGAGTTIPHRMISVLH